MLIPCVAPAPRSSLPSRVIHNSFYFNDDVYRSNVLSLRPEVTESEVDEHLACEARDLGLLPLIATVQVDRPVSALSQTVVDSPKKYDSDMSHSTAPASSSSSSERPPPTRASMLSDFSPPNSATPSILSDMSRKRENGFRKGIRKMTTFRKRRSLAITSSTLTSIDSDAANTNGDRLSLKSGLKSPGSIESNKSLWSRPPFPAKTAYEHTSSPDPEAVQRSAECPELQALRSRQLDERSKFLDYQRSALSQLRAQYQDSKQNRRQAHQKVIDESIEKNYKLIEELESRQLEEEIRLIQEFGLEKRAVTLRLRHMEAYCQNPTPPPTPVDPDTGRPSLDHTQLPERKVTDKDYHNLAARYRERDVMDDLHRSKINVLRGKQKKAVENFTNKREAEIDRLQHACDRELERLGEEERGEEDAVKAVFDAKRHQLESRWRIQARIERAKMERQTGLAHADLGDVRALDDDDDDVGPESGTLAVGSRMNSVNGHQIPG